MLKNKKTIALLAAGSLLGGFLLVSMAAAEAPKPPNFRFANTPVGRMILGNLGRALTLRSELNVSEEQRARVKEIVKNHKASIVPAAQSLKDKRLALRKAVMADAPDEKAIRMASEELGKAIADAAVLASKIRSEVKPVFTEEQRQLLEKFLEESEASADHILKEFAGEQ